MDTNFENPWIPIIGKCVLHVVDILSKYTI